MARALCAVRRGTMGVTTFLQRLLLIHGFWSYARQVRLINYQIYVQMLYNTLLFCYQFSTAFSQQVRGRTAGRGQIAPQRCR